MLHDTLLVTRYVSWDISLFRPYFLISGGLHRTFLIKMGTPLAKLGEREKKKMFRSLGAGFRLIKKIDVLWVSCCTRSDPTTTQYSWCLSCVMMCILGGWISVQYTRSYLSLNWLPQTFPGFLLLNVPPHVLVRKMAFIFPHYFTQLNRS